jgi:hypothetical protein
VVVPGRAPRVLVPPSVQRVTDLEWSPDGRTLALELGPDGRQHRRRGVGWPRRPVAREYSMFSRGGDAAVYRIVRAATRRLRRGASREAALRPLRIAITRLTAYHPEVTDTESAEAIVWELNRWLRRAGLELIEARDEIEC